MWIVKNKVTFVTDFYVEKACKHIFIDGYLWAFDCHKK